MRHEFILKNSVTNYSSNPKLSRKITLTSNVDLDINVPFWIWVEKFRRCNDQMLLCRECVVDIGRGLPLRHLVYKDHLAIFVEVFA